jgi:hypothetical protein
MEIVWRERQVPGVKHQEAAEVPTCVAGHLHGCGQVHDFGRAILEVRFEFGGEALEEVGGTVVTVVAQHGRIMAPGVNPLGDRHESKVFDKVPFNLRPDRIPAIIGCARATLKEVLVNEARVLLLEKTSWAPSAVRGGDGGCHGCRATGSRRGLCPFSALEPRARRTA